MYILNIFYFTIFPTLEQCIVVSSMYLPHSFNIQVGNVLYCNEYSCATEQQNSASCVACKIFLPEIVIYK